MENYYDNANPDILNLLEDGVERVLELGCGGGGLAFAVKQKLGPKLHYAGIELFADAAMRASNVIDVVLQRNLDDVPDWDADPEMAEKLPRGTFDYVICGDVLEHLYAPDVVLKQAVSRLAPGGTFLACIPNVQHWSVFAQLVLGHWPQEDSGLFDRTHIRWFTLNDMLLLMQGVGLRVDKVIPRVFDEKRAIDVLEYLEPLAMHLGVDPEGFVQRGMPLQYVFAAKKLA